MANGWDELYGIFAGVGSWLDHNIIGSVSEVYHDGIGIAKQLAGVPDKVVDTGNNLVNRVNDTIQTTVPILGNTITQTTGNIFQGPIVWIAGIGAALIFGPKLIASFNTT